MTSEQVREPGFFHGLARVFHRDRESADAAAEQATPSYVSAAKQLDERLKELTVRLEERRLEEERRAAIESGQIDPAADKAQRTMIKETRAAETHAQVRRDVLAWHARLSTGVDSDELDRLHAFMGEMKEMAAAKPGCDMDARIRGAIVRRLFQETGERAWERLLALMEAAGEAWPASDEMSRDAEAAAAAEVFLQSGPFRSADLVVGIVEVWRDHYPSPGTPLWHSVCLRAVAAALRARMLKEMVQIVRMNAQELRAEGERLLEKEVAAVQAVLAEGVESVEQADRVMAGASELLERVLPELCWEKVRGVGESER